MLNPWRVILKTNILNPKNGGLVQMIFLFRRGAKIRFQPLVSMNGCTSKQYSPRKTNECPLENPWLVQMFCIEIVPFLGDIP